MDNIEIDHERMIFTRNGHPFFYLADTAWMAFSNIELTQWREYLRFRRRQGFTVVQISILPVLNDTGTGPETLYPYTIEADGKMNFQKRNNTYFERAEAMVKMVIEEGLVPALVVLWNNYIPTSWASVHIKGISNVSVEFLPEYAGIVAKYFGKYNPFLLISGDTMFENDVVCEYYKTLYSEVRKQCPSSLITMHLAPDIEIPADVCGMDGIDFYMYQSGHQEKQVQYAYTLAEKFNTYPIKRPIVNGEPCYEGHVCCDREAVRYSAADVRRAIWQSLLSGAKAGVTYGAHGIWMFYQEGMSFNNRSFSGSPFLWRDAIEFPGAWDAAYSKILFDNLNLYDIWPRQSLIPDAPAGVRAAADEKNGLVAVYSPYAEEFMLELDLSGYKTEMIRLDNRRYVNPTLVISEGKTCVKMAGCNSDSLFLARKL